MAKERAASVRLPMVAARGLAAAANNMSLSICVPYCSDGLGTILSERKRTKNGGADIRRILHPTLTRSAVTVTGPSFPTAFAIPTPIQRCQEKSM